MNNLIISKNAINTKMVLLILIISLLIGFVSLNKFALSTMIILLLLIGLLKGLIKNFLGTWQLILMGIMIHSFFVLYIIPNTLDLSSTVISLIKAWKEIVVFISIPLIIFIKRVNLYKKSKKLDHIDFLMWTILFLIVISIYHSYNIASSFYGIRNYAIGFIVYFIFKNISIKPSDLYKLIKNLGIFISLLTIWGIFQARVLGDAFLISLQNPNTGILNYAFYISGFYGMQRVVSTFASPNTFAIVDVIFALFFLGDIIIASNKSKLNYVALIILMMGLILSFSRSSWIGFFIGAVLIFYFQYKRKTILVGIKYLLIPTVIVLLIGSVFEIEVVTTVVTYLKNTISLKDTSTVGHISSIINSINFIETNPMGVGVGQSGPKSVIYSNGAIYSESSYFILAFDIGIIGMVMYILLYFTILKKIFLLTRIKDDFISFLSKVIFSMWLAILIAYLFLPLIQELEHVYLIYSFTGALLGMKKSYQKLI